MTTITPNVPPASIDLPNRAGTVSAPDRITADRITKSLLGYGVIAGPVYVTVSLTQALTRDGFDLGRHAWSQLALGGPGWIHVTNLIGSGLMVLAAAAGFRRALEHGPAARAFPMLLAVFGLSMIVSGLAPVDAAAGFPADTGAPAAMSVSAAVHLAAGGVGFLALTAALLALGRRLRMEGARRPALACRIVGPVFLAAFLAMASGTLGGSGIGVFTVAVVGVLALLSMLSVHRYRQQPDCS